MKKFAVVLVVIVFAFASCDMTGQRHVLDIPAAMVGTWEYKPTGAGDTADGRFYIDKHDIVASGLSCSDMINDPSCTSFSQDSRADYYAMTYSINSMIFTMTFTLEDKDTLYYTASIDLSESLKGTYKRIQ